MSEACLIVGLGKIGMGYDFGLDPSKAIYSHARAFTHHPQFTLSGAVDPSPAQRALFESYYGLPAYQNLRDALHARQVGVVVIASPTAAHAETLISILSYAKPKAILCEKPLADNLADARRMVKACEAADVKLFVNYMRRADPGAIEIKNLIESGKIAAPIKGVAWYSKGFMHNGSHFFNLLEFWLGAFVNAKILDSGRILDNQDTEPDVQVEFEQGKVVFIAAWEEAFSHYTIELLSPAGRLRYEQGGEWIAWQSTRADPNFADYEILQAVPEMITNGMNRYQWHVADQLANALADQPHTLCTGKQSLATLEAMHQIIDKR